MAHSVKGLSLPNARSEYYQVIEDIENVLGLRCRTITVGILLILIWHFQELAGITGQLFTTKSGGADLSVEIKNNLVDTLPSTEPYPGAYRTSK